MAADAALPRLVATDLDGTLVRRDGSVSDFTRAVLRDVEAAGIPVVFVTGRPLRWAEEVFEHVGEHGLAIVANGALVWDVAGECSRLQRPIDAETALAAARAIRDAVPGAHFAAEDLDGISLETGFVERFPVPGESRRVRLEDLFDRPVLKLLARHEEHDPQHFWDAAREAVGDRAVVTWSSTTALLEISAAGVTKATSLALLCDELGIDAQDVVAFGDMPNDLPMLAWAGRSWAMTNAHPSVIEAADHLAPHHEDDGVARVLAELVPGAGR